MEFRALLPLTNDINCRLHMLEDWSFQHCVQDKNTIAQDIARLKLVVLVLSKIAGDAVEESSDFLLYLATFRIVASLLYVVVEVDCL
ncbi:hypothetical protein YC2023_122471 [Brassica napus]